MDMTSTPLRIGIALGQENAQYLRDLIATHFSHSVTYYYPKYDLFSETLSAKIDFLIWDMKSPVEQCFTRERIGGDLDHIIYLDQDNLETIKAALREHPFDLWIKGEHTPQEMLQSLEKLIRRRQWLTQHRIWQTIVDLVPVSLVISNAKGDIEYVNPQFEKVSGYKSAELIGKNPRLLKSDEHDAAFYQNMWETIAAGKIWEGEICNRNKRGRLYWEQLMIVPFRDQYDQITHYIAFRVDDTDRRRAEEALRKADALRSVQELAGGVAHEFSQPLQVLTITLSMLENKLPGDDLVARCERMAQRIIELVNHLKNITELKQQDYLETKILNLKASALKRKQSGNPE